MVNCLRPAVSTCNQREASTQHEGVSGSGIELRERVCQHTQCMTNHLCSADSSAACFASVVSK